MLVRKFAFRVDFPLISPPKAIGFYAWFGGNVELNTVCDNMSHAKTIVLLSIILVVYNYP